MITSLKVIESKTRTVKKLTKKSNIVYYKWLGKVLSYMVVRAP